MDSDDYSNSSNRIPIIGLLIIGILGVITYLPAFNNFFISDDFVYLRLSKAAEHDIRQIFNFPPDVRRLTGHIYFFVCHKLFLLNPIGYYAIMLALHIINSFLVYRLVAHWTKDNRIGLMAGLFFAAYERHQEAVMWLAAVHELWLCLGSLLCLVFLGKFLSGNKGYGKYYYLVIFTFILTLFSKESSVVLFPLMLVFDVLWSIKSLDEGRSRRVRLYLPLGGLWITYLVLSYVWNSFIAHGVYAVTSHFFLVYLKTVNRLLIFVYVCGLLAYIFSRGGEKAQYLMGLKRSRVFLFFLVWVLLTPAPYCFLTYLDHIPSRQTYLPSVGTAGLVGILMAELFSRVQARRFAKAIPVVIFIGILVLNTAYVWKKDQQFVKRAEPTKILIQMLSTDTSFKSSGGKVYVVSESPMGVEYAFRSAVELFTDVNPSHLIFLKPGDADKVPVQASDYVFKWNDKTEAIEVIEKPTARRS